MLDWRQRADPLILEWAATHGLVLLTHDGKTIPAFALRASRGGPANAGVFLVDDRLPIGQAIEEILPAAHCLTPEECKDIVMFFPM